MMLDRGRERGGPGTRMGDECGMIDVTYASCIGANRPASPNAQTSNDPP